MEGLSVARAIVAGFKHDTVVPKLWATPGVFEAGGATLDTLMKEVDAADFAMFVFDPDDKITSRDDRYRGPRDNVVFELGLPRQQAWGNLRFSWRSSTHHKLAAGLRSFVRCPAGYRMASHERIRAFGSRSARSATFRSSGDSASSLIAALRSITGSLRTRIRQARSRAHAVALEP
jgi:hypothetical protein